MDDERQSLTSGILQGKLFLISTIIFLAFTSNLIFTVLRKGLRNLPGPVFARFSGLYRLSLVASGDAPAQYQRVHKKYGKIARIGPNHVSISDPAMIQTIYGIGSKFDKTPFYSTMDAFYREKPMPSIFSTRDPAYHRDLKVPVAQLFSMTNMKNFEPYADDCTRIFIDAMRDLEGTPVDAAVWLQWYAFDVIASITFQRRFGFMERRRDLDGMIAGLEGAGQYIKIVGQYPGLHKWLLGNRPLVRLLQALFPNLPDPLSSFLTITEDEIKKYDSAEKGHDRTDFLAQLRAKESKSGKINHDDMINHLSNNLLAGSDTTGISLRACFYYLIKNPRTYQRLVAEIEEADRKGELSEFITYAECLKLPYLQAVMKEAMRLHPGVGFPLERYVPAGGATICDINLPGGTIVSMSAPVVHHDESVFGSDADSFQPERWIEASSEQLKIMDRSFFAFGAGARTCIGKNISIMEMGKFVPQILRHFDLEWASTKPDWDLHAAWFWKQSNMIVKFKCRQKS